MKRYAEFFKDRTNFERFKYLNVEIINDQGIKSQHMQDFADKIKAYYEKKKAVKSELKALQKDEKFWTESSQYEVVVPVGWDINHKEVCFESVTNKTTRSFATTAGAGNPISCMC